MNTEILWLPSWYPNALAPYNGDFIQRHARAVSLFNNITVIFIKKDEDAAITKNIKEIVYTENKLKEITIFYHSFKTGFRLADKIISSIRYRKIYRKAIKKYITLNGKPRLVHVHVAFKAGIFGMWLKRKFGIPYILSEHWSGYFKENKYGINKLGYFQKKILKKIIVEAGKVTVVSKVLGEAITNYFTNIKYDIIPNTVDDCVFYPIEHINIISVFIHISSLNYEKNPFQIIEAFHLVKEKGYVFKLVIYGPERKDLKAFIEKKSLSELIEFREEVPQVVLAEELKKSDALILFSHYETFGCVVIEANACGVPAIVSDLNVFREHVDENINGVFAKRADAVHLSKKLIEFIDKKYQFDKALISKNTIEKFGYKIVGKKFTDLYEKF